MRITAGKFKNKQIKSIDSELIRPTLSKIRESLFNVLQNDIENSSFLDLFAGSGIMGIEAASRNAKNVIFIEKNPKHFKLLKNNLKDLDFEYKTFLSDSTLMIERFEENSFDIIYSDPPYKTDLNNKILQIISKKNLLKDNGWLILECSKDEDFTNDIEANSFEIIKEKLYGDTKVLYLKQN